ncbi:glycoside hydrolase family 43 protein [Bifidobacterium eulemuris]|uniref:1,4-beta-xylanase n=1 Tax=Bifidobacterium eulemuris TaxID=1765219 RepID=A0A261G3D2_9BIFI|nr:glycoside hydrolase family 43 protein [Bifidobacterium eulemuris]OZG65931.1 1,4-beta-xylanase [Bifidobacterium eulemuris]QOL31997.1 glycoside hydrolase family 43 protein [Bifidobacterium eulemuris]
MTDAVSACNIPQPQPPADPYGYLLVHFLEDDKGYAERIYLDVSQGDNPERWHPLNGGAPILTSNLGTTGVRDPYLVRDPETGTVYIIATDLRVFGGDDIVLEQDLQGCDPDEQDWESYWSIKWTHWSHHGSTKLIVWKSEDLVHWSEPWELDVSRRPDGGKEELGMAWAPECLWVPDYHPQGHVGGRGAFVVYWSSRLFDSSDPDHSDASAYDRVMWGATRDFTNETFEFGGTFIDRGHNTIDTTMLQRRLPDGKIRTYRATKDNGPRPGIWLDATDARRWWEDDAEWTVLQENIGVEYVPDRDPSGVEGPALFASHSDDKVYLYVDVIPSIGYRPMVAVDPDKGFEYLETPDFVMAPHTKHGGVLSLTKAEYDRLRDNDGRIGVE